MYRGLSLDQAPPEDIPIRFFVTAPLFGILGGLLLIFFAPDLFASRWSNEALAFTHTLTLGWLAMIMMGAYYQMIPVLVGGSVPYIGLSRYVHALVTLGTLILVVAFLWDKYVTLLMIVAGTFLGGGLFLFLFPITISLFQVTAKGRPTVFAMRFSIIALAGTLIFGLLFVGDWSGLWNYSMTKTAATGFHIIFGLFGWIGMLIVGVGFYVLTMFYLTPVFGNRLALYNLFFFGFSILAFPLMVWLEANTLIMILMGVPGFIGTLLFTSRIYWMIAKRKRKAVDATMKFWWFGLAFFPISLLIPWIPVDSDQRDLLFGHLFLVCFALPITTGMLYKILPFILWFHRFSHKIGKENVPLLRDLLPNRKSNQQFLVFVMANVSIFLTIILELDWLGRISGVLLGGSFVMIFLNVLYSLRIAQKG